MTIDKIIQLDTAAQAAFAGRGAAEAEVGTARLDEALTTWSQALRSAAGAAEPRLVAVLAYRVGRLFAARGAIQKALLCYEQASASLNQNAGQHELDPLLDSMLHPPPAPATQPVDPGASDAGHPAPDPDGKAYPTPHDRSRSGGLGNRSVTGAALALPAVYFYDLAPGLVEAANDPLLEFGLALAAGGVYLQMPQPAPAGKAYRGAWALAKAHGGPLQEGYALANIGEAYSVAGDLEKARALFTWARTLIGRHGQPHDLRTLLVMQAALEQRADTVADPNIAHGPASALYEEALYLYKQGPGDDQGQGRALAGYGLVALQQQQLDLAESRYVQALPLARSTRDLDSLIWILRGLGFCAAARDDDALALDRYNEAKQLIKDRQRALGTDEGRVGFLESVQPIYDELIALHVRKGRASDALALVSETRGMGLYNLVRQGRRAPGSQQMGVQSAPAVLSVWLDDDDRPEPEPATKLNRVAYYSLPDRLLIFVEAPGVGLHVYEEQALGRATLRKHVQLLREVIDAKAWVDPAAGAEQPDLFYETYKLLLGGVTAHLPEPGTLLVIEPHDTLWLVPFAALRTQPAGPWFGDAYPLLYSISQATLNEIRAEQTPNHAQAPDGDGASGGAAITLVAAHTAMKIEALRIAELYADPVLLFDHEADDILSGELPSHSQIWHFATHGRAVEEVPLDSWLELSNRQQLRARDVVTMDFDVSLVTLSACQTALGALTGDGIIGLSRAFIAAGARSVIVSQWNVNSNAAERLMLAFYRELTAGANKAVALQSAMTAVRDAYEGAYAHPKAWAPFILIGAED
ncbi:MAG: CHAT domain-containing protein [Chloroflexales bacterium]|nr:CHAT domain-containing protein [Chloroflexales bacterium]